jgi:hypothetical protein
MGVGSGVNGWWRWCDEWVLAVVLAVVWWIVVGSGVVNGCLQWSDEWAATI